jgi:predicted ATP-dependent endonuclease of OLD family
MIPSQPSIIFISDEMKSRKTSAEQIAEKAELSVRNIGGINSTSVGFSGGATILAGENATNRTPLLQAIMAALGSGIINTMNCPCSQRDTMRDEDEVREQYEFLKKELDDSDMNHEEVRKMFTYYKRAIGWVLEEEYM